MRIVVALGGNALLRRGEPMSAAVQRRNVRAAARALAPVAAAHELVISHGNGPQVGLLALQSAAHAPEQAYPLDVLDAETEGMIGYMIEQELGNRLAAGAPIATVLTMIEVDPEDPAFADPSKFIGPLYDEAEARRLAARTGWALKPDGTAWRRVVVSPKPQRILELRPIRWLLDKGTVVICAGGGGIPTVRDEDGTLRGVEAVIDKDLASELLARELAADLLVMATDVDAAYVGWQTPRATGIKRAAPAALARYEFAAGSMGPKVEAACRFAAASGRPAAIGALDELAQIVAGRAGTTVVEDAGQIEWHAPAGPARP